ncbi:MAG: type II toxin-antitoxin system PemK/MazF family toxin [Patescibacteria group bacterium]
MADEIAERGDIWIVDLEPGTHRELHKKRPALVFSENVINQKSFSVIVIPISSQVPHTIGPEMVTIGEKEGLEKQSVLLPIFIRSIDQKRLMKKVGSLERDKLEEVIKAVKLLLSL